MHLAASLGWTRRRWYCGNWEVSLFCQIVYHIENINFVVQSGKTLAFGIPALCHLLKRPMKANDSSTISVLVVAPTRELALQTHDTLSSLGKPFGIASVAVFGGVPKEPQARMLKKASRSKDGMTTRIIVGTPGRILDFMQEGVCDLSEYAPFKS
jgi:ATP-dependent RNA helicase DBP3